MQICLLVYFFVILLNYGFMGTDEYWVGMVKYLPAQTALFSQLLAADDVKSPTQLLPFYGLAQVAWRLGIESAYLQYRFVILVLTALAVFLSILSFKTLSELPKDLYQPRFSFLMGLFTFHAAFPGIISRPMFEALAMPWLLLSCVFAMKYAQTKNLKDIFVSTAAICMAFLLRPQTGLCAVVVVSLPLLVGGIKKEFWLQSLKICGFGITVFLLAGLPDLYWHQEYHYSLKAITVYNYKFGAAYTAKPWYFYFPILFGLCWGPFLFARYGKNFWNQFRYLHVPLCFLLAFFVTHLLFANKFDRFIFPWLGIIAILLEPFVRYFWENHKRYRLRILSVLLLNFGLWIPASFSSAQKSLIDFPVYLEAHQEISRVVIVDKAVEWFAQVLLQRPVEVIEENLQSLLRFRPSGFYLLNQAQQEAESRFWAACEVTQWFRPNILDELAFKFNPGKNQRRAPLVLLNCP